MEYEIVEALTLAEESSFLQAELGFIILLAIAALVAIVIRRIRIPYTVALVLVGLALSVVPSFINLEDIGDEVILAILVPPLLFEATLYIPWRRLRNDLWLILLLAFVGTFIGAAIVGGIVSQVLVEVPLVAAFAFGALISATDPVAVIAFFRRLGVSKRLATLVEGESLFNDGVAIVLFNLAIGAAVAGTATISIGSAVLDFIYVAFGGLGVGLVLGYVVSSIFLKNLDDHLIETLTTVALAFGAYVVAEQFHVSGILAVVAAGLMVGNIGMQNTSPTTRITLDNFWEFLAFVANSIVFLLIGLEIDINLFVPNLVPIIVAVIAVLFSRGIIVYSFTAVFNWLVPRKAVPRSYQRTMYWGGLRGAISLALALTLSTDLFGVALVQELQVMTFGVVLFTLLVQGTTIEGLIRRLGLAKKREQNLEQQRRQAQIYARQAGLRELDRLHDNGILFPDLWEAMRSVYEERIDDHKSSLRSHIRNFPELEQEMYLQARADILRAERSAIADASMRGLISDAVMEEMIIDANNRIEALELINASRRRRDPAPTRSETEGNVEAPDG